jgi:hypothetical protein
MEQKRLTISTLTSSQLNGNPLDSVRFISNDQVGR